MEESLLRSETFRRGHQPFGASTNMVRTSSSCPLRQHQGRKNKKKQLTAGCLSYRSASPLSPSSQLILTSDPPTDTNKASTQLFCLFQDHPGDGGDEVGIPVDEQIVKATKFTKFPPMHSSATSRDLLDKGLG